MLKIAIWTSMPSLHQRPMYEVLWKRDIDLQVRYFERVIPERIAQGWPDPRLDTAHEGYIKSGIDPLETLSDWRERVHILSGYRFGYLRKLVRAFGRGGVEWIHWSESVTTHRLFGLLRWPVLKWYGRLGRKFALGAFAMDPVGKRQFLSWGFDSSTILHLPYSIQLDSCESSPVAKQIMEFARTRMVFGFIGSMIPRKGVDKLILACTYLKKYGFSKNLCVVLVGPESSVIPVNRSLSDYDLSNFVLYTGPVPMNHVRSVISTISVLVHPALSDGWGATLSEAALSGKAVISTEAVGSARVLLKHGVTGMLVPPGDVEALAKAILLYALNPQLAEDHGKAIQAIAMDYCAEHNADRLVNGIEFLRLKKSIDNDFCKETSH